MSRSAANRSRWPNIGVHRGPFEDESMEAPEVIVWSRDTVRAWQHQTLHGLDAVIEVPTLDLSLRLADLHAGLGFRPRPRLVEAETGR